MNQATNQPTNPHTPGLWTWRTASYLQQIWIGYLPSIHFPFLFPKGLQFYLEIQVIQGKLPLLLAQWELSQIGYPIPCQSWSFVEWQVA